MTQTRNLVVALATGLALAGCARIGDPFGSSPPAPVAAPAPAPTAGGVPTVEVAAPGNVVRDILVTRARSRGASPTLTAAAVVIQRALPSTNESLAAACGPHQPGRAVRVVLGTQPIATGTRLTEQRFIIDGQNVCPLPLNAADVAEAERSLGEVKQQAEMRTARR